MVKLHLGCGRDIKKGYLNVDIVKLPGVDQVVNLDKFPYPFKDNTFTEIYCRHLMEHLTDIFAAMEEFNRILKKRGRIKIIAPYFSGHGAYGDPQHQRFFTYTTMNYWDKYHYYSDVKVRIIKKKIFFLSSRGFMRSRSLSIIPDFLISLAPMFYQRFLCWIFPSAEIHYVVEIVK